MNKICFLKSVLTSVLALLCFSNVFFYSVISVNAEITHDKIKNADQKILYSEEKRDLIDWSYVKHLDLMIGREALDSGFVETLRFNNGYIDSIEEMMFEDYIPARVWERDKGPGAAYVMTFLFPSAGKVLSSYSGSSDFFCSYDPSPELMAHLFCVTRAIRKRQDFELQRHNFIKLALKGVSAGHRCSMKRKLNGFLKALKEMIEKQELNDKVFPEYTTEKILLAFFVDHFNDVTDAERFYNELLTLMIGPSDEKQIDVVNDLKKMFLNKHFNSAFKTCFDKIGKPLQTGESYLINYQVDKANFVGRGELVPTFSNCVETSIRNIFNLLLYDSEKNDFLFREELSSDDVTYIESLKNAIENLNPIDLKNKREMLRLFYAVQNPDESTNGNNFFSNLWSFTLSNIGDENLEGLYPLRYAKEKNELCSGLLNVLKACWNLTFLLNEKNVMPLVALKQEIDDIEKFLLESSIEVEVVEPILKSAFEKVFSLVNSKYAINIEIENLRVETCKRLINVKDFFGDVCVSVSERQTNRKLFDFSIIQNNGHSQVDYSKENELLPIGEFLNRDEENETVNSKKFYDVVTILILYREIFDDTFFNIEPFCIEIMKEPVVLEYSNDIIMQRRVDREKIKLTLYSAIFDRIKEVGLGRDFIACYCDNFDGNSKKIQVVEDNQRDWVQKRRFITTLVTKQCDLNDFVNDCMGYDFYEQVGGKTIFSKAIESMSDSQFDLFVNGNKVNKDFFIDHFNEIVAYDDNEECNAFEYAVKLNKWTKAKILISLLSYVSPYNYNFKSGNERFNVIGWLLKEKRLDILEENKAKFDFSVVVCKTQTGEEYSGYDYISKLGDEELKNRIDPNSDIRKRICNDAKIDIEDIKKLSSKELFQVPQINLDKPRKSMMAFVIEKLDIDDFKKILDCVEGQCLIRDKVYYYGNNGNGFDYGINSLVYALKSREFEKAEQILIRFGDVCNQYDLPFVEGETKYYSILGFLLKEKKYEIIKANKSKFEFNQLIVFEDCDTSERYTAKEFITQVLKDNNLIRELNI